MADHLGRGADDLHGVLAVARHRRAPPRHDDEQVADVGDVRDAPQRVVHHDLLEKEAVMLFKEGKSFLFISSLEKAAGAEV